MNYIFKFFNQISEIFLISYKIMQESNQSLKNPLLGTKIVEKIVRFELLLTVIGQLCKSYQYEDIPKQDFSRIEF